MHRCGRNVTREVLTGATLSNLTFGGQHRSRLFICASHAIMAVYTNVRGTQGIMRALALLGVSLTVSDLGRLVPFYVEALVFSAEP